MYKIDKGIKLPDPVKIREEYFRNLPPVPKFNLIKKLIRKLTK